MPGVPFLSLRRGWSHRLLPAMSISLPEVRVKRQKDQQAVAHRVAAVAGSRPLNRVGRDACDNTRGPAGGGVVSHSGGPPFSGLATYPVFSRCAASVAGLIQEQAAGSGRREAPSRPQAIDQPCNYIDISTGIGLIASGRQGALIGFCPAVPLAPTRSSWPDQAQRVPLNARGRMMETF
jgi:hypothetical protein